MKLQRGTRGKLGEHLDVSKPINISLEIKGAAVYDYTCFGLDADGKLSDDRYMIFYNQKNSPRNEITFVEPYFEIKLAELPPTIDKLVFTASIDGKGTMREILFHKMTVAQFGENILTCELVGKDFSAEKAIISLELYRKKGEWRFGVVARGYNGGLSDLLRDFGGEEIKPETVEEVPQQKSEKISLKKGQKISLTKKNDDKPIIIENGWTASGKDYDLKALVRYRDGTLIYVGAANEDEFLKTPEGAVEHGGDIKVPGEMEKILIRWHPAIASVAVSSYSALENGTGPFKSYGVFVRITNGKQIIEIPAASTSKNTYSYTLCFGEIIFGEDKTFEVSALEMYSASHSENRIGYIGDRVVMDIGPVGQPK